MKKTNKNNFSSGPCCKRPDWNVNVLQNALVGRSHKAKPCLDRVKEIMLLQREILQLPNDFKIGIIMGSDTAAIESTFWNLLGERGVDCINFDVFGNKWYKDIKNILKIADVREFKADFGKIPDISNVDMNRDVVFCLNGTTSGTFLDLDFIKKDRQGLVFCDATSSAFAYKIDWEKVDVLTYSWQKVLGGEAGHGIVIVSPKALERLNNFTPNRPIPSFMNLKSKDMWTEGLTLNTLSMLCVEDFRDALLWAKSNGGLEFLIKKTKENSDYLYNYLDNSNVFKTLCDNKKYRSKTSITFEFKENNTEERLKVIIDLLNKENIAVDFKGHRDAPLGFRVWCGPTIDLEDIKILCEWLDFAT
ncbi:MAG: phosphoserine transaminase [Rickettsiales bacterium]|jgi:phosphoserine aminotransferase|nr:phosphoserine transaminase [Rickettsiales bacterium]